MEEESRRGLRVGCCMGQTLLLWLCLLGLPDQKGTQASAS